MSDIYKRLDMEIQNAINLLVENYQQEVKESFQDAKLMIDLLSVSQLVKDRALDHQHNEEEGYEF